MFRAFSRLKHTILCLVFLAVWGGNAFFWQNELLGRALFAAYLIFFGKMIGRWVAEDEHPAIQWWIGTWTLLSLVMIAGAVAYYAAEFTAPVAFFLVLITAPIALFLSRKRTTRPWFERAHDQIEDKPRHGSAFAWVLAAMLLTILAVVVNMIRSSATVDAVRSPWLLVPSAALVGMVAIQLLLQSQTFRGKQRGLTILLVITTLALFLSVAYFVFPIGYGFDPFIHQATEEHIAQFGTISPKPFYYVGQYALMLFAHHAFSLPIRDIDPLLLPLLAALLLPLAWYAAAAHITSSRRNAMASIAGLFLIPLSSFIVTTPQGLANLWTLLLILAAVPYLMRTERPRVFLLAIPALAAVLTHPIAGLPALLFLALIACEPRLTNARWKTAATVFYWGIAAVGSVLLPASFVVNALRSGGSPGLDLSALSPASMFSALHLDLIFANRFNPILDFVYLYGFNAFAFIVLIAAIGWYLARHEEARPLRVCIVMAVVLGVNYVILSTAVDFSFLIDYERQGYAERLIPLIAFFLTPLLIVALGRIASRLRLAPFSVRFGAIALVSFLATSAFYLTYPRYDSYESSHGFNVSQSDVGTAFAIDRDASDISYVVLANQSVSAAAMRELGFAHYFGDTFYYPIPTGGELYDLFLQMNERPNRAIANDAMDLANAHCEVDAACTQQPVDTVYYVVNDYWWQANRLIETGKQTADTWFSIDGGKLYVFRYDRHEIDGDPVERDQ